MKRQHNTGQKFFVGLASGIAAGYALYLMLVLTAKTVLTGG